MSLAFLDAPRSATIPAPRRDTVPAGAIAQAIPELSEERWALIQARLRATGVPAEPEDDGAAARMLGGALLLGLGLLGLAICGLWVLLA